MPTIFVKLLERQAAKSRSQVVLRKTCTVIRKIGGVRRNRIGFSFAKKLSRNFQRRMEKEMKTNSKINGYIIRGAVYAVFLSVTFIAASWAFQSPNKWYKSAVASGVYGSTAKSPSQPRAFSFAERVAFQRAIEDVYWRHRIWPRNNGENPDPKPSLDAVMSQAQLEKKVTDYLRTHSAGRLLAAADYCRSVTS